MNNTKKLSAFIACAAVLGSSFTSCTDSFESWNTDPNEVTEEMMEQDNLKTGALFSQMLRGVFPVGQDKGGTYQIHQMLNGDNYAGYFANIKDSYDIGSVHHDHYSMVPKWYNIPFNDTYPEIMEPWRRIHSVTTETSVDRALATVVKVLAMQRMTDKYGPIPYTKFGTALSVPYDSQETVYNRFFEELDEAIEVINTYNTSSTKPYMERYDYIYRGNVTKWAKLANTLRLRCAMRISYANPDKAKQEIQKALADQAGFMTAASDDAAIQNSGSFTYTNPIYEVTQGFNDMRMSATIECYLKGYEDPRLEAYFKAAESDGEYHGMRNGMTSGFSNMLTCTSPANYTTTSAVPWMHAAEAYFLLAEAKLRFGLGTADVKDLYEQGVRTSFESAGVSGADQYLADNEKTPLDEWVNPSRNGNKTNVSNMVSGLTVAWDDAASTETKLERIMIQKWLALYPDGCEAWAEMRRTGYPGWVRINTYNNASGVADNDMIRRIQFPSTEYSDNAKNVQEAVTLLGGTDNAGTHLWWDCK